MKAPDLAVLVLCVIGAVVLSGPFAFGFVLFALIVWAGFRRSERKVG
jgi:integral membrane sensor domain MASE1